MIDTRSVELLIEAFGKLSKADVKGSATSYVLAVPYYQEGERGSDHSRIEQMVIVGDWYFGKGTFLLYDGSVLAGQFSYELVKKLFDDSQNLKAHKDSMKEATHDK